MLITEKEKLSANIWKLYLYWFCHSLIFGYVIERLFAAEKGLNIQQMVYLEIIYAGVVLILEIPTGILADIWSRKNVMIISSIFIFFEFFFLIFANSFCFFVFSAVSAAIGGALASGTENALFYDSLKLIGQQDKFEKVLGRNKFFSMISAIIAALIGSYLGANYGYTTAYWFSLIGVSIAVFITFTLHEPNIIPRLAGPLIPSTELIPRKAGPLLVFNPEPDSESILIKTSVSEFEEGNAPIFNFKEAVNFLRKNSGLRFVMFYAVIIGATITYLDEYWQVYLKEINIPVSVFGFYSMLYLLMEIGSGVISYKLKEKFSYKAIFSFCILVAGISIIITSFCCSIWGVLPLLIAFLMYGITEPLSFGYLHHRTDSAHRATVESFCSLVLRLATIFVGLLFGYIATKFSIFSGFRALGFILLIYSLYYFINQHKYVEEEVTGGIKKTEEQPELFCQPLSEREVS